MLARIGSVFTANFVVVAIVTVATFAHAEDDTKREAFPRLALAHTLEGHKSIVRCVGFHADTDVLVTGGSDRSVRVWDGAAGKALAEHKLPRSG